jgi:hypothetical protein
MYSSTPVAILLSVALAAHPVRLLERHPLPAREVQEIAIVGVVAIQAPPILLVVLQHDVVVVLDDASCAVCLQIGMTERAGKNAL